MPEIMFPEWRDDNTASKYPFSDRASLKTVAGLSFEPDLFLDAAIYPIGGRERQYLSRIRVTSRLVTIVTGDPKTAELATTTFDPLAPPDILTLADAFGRPAGVLVSDAERLAVFQTWPLQEHKFDPTATEFAASCVTPMPQIGVRGFMTPDGELFTGDVWIVGEDGVVVRQGENADEIRIDIVGDPLFRRRLCQPVQLFTTPRFIQTINGMKPDELGDFKITVGRTLASDTVLRVYADTKGGITIEAVGQTLQGVK
jgi:hypothetical protein